MSGGVHIEADTRKKRTTRTNLGSSAYVEVCIGSIYDISTHRNNSRPPRWRAKSSSQVAPTSSTHRSPPLCPSIESIPLSKVTPINGDTLSTCSHPITTTQILNVFHGSAIINQEHSFLTSSEDNVDSAGQTGRTSDSPRKPKRKLCPSSRPPSWTSNIA